MLSIIALSFVLLSSAECYSANLASKAEFDSPPLDFSQRSDSQALAPFFDTLKQLELGQRSEAVKVIQFGDSHTASDRFTGALRKLLQNRFGNAGRGTLAAGVPFDYYRPTNVKVQQGRGWQTFTSNKRGATGIFGSTGFRLRGSSHAKSTWLKSLEPKGFDRVALTIISQPGGGSLIVDVDGRKRYTVATDGDQVQAKKINIPVPQGSHRLSITPTGNGAVELLSWNFERNTAGLVYDNYGISGATADVMSSFSPSTVAWELQQRQPSLIVVSYGTNEGFYDRINLQVYEQNFAEHLRMLAEAAPAASILVIGPPDAARYPKRCAKGHKKSARCRSLRQDEINNYQRKFVSSPSASSCVWHTPPNIPKIREIQRRTAFTMGFAFWDWSQVMGGSCGVNNWVRNDPPLAYADHIHYRQAGANISAKALFDDLMRGYNAYRANKTQEY
ncbi:MAG: hypothetical protein R8K20_03960 [Gallionellaceae bacterium]